MNLVDIDKLKELIADPDDSARYGYLSMFDLENAEIIEAEPVKHGKWLISSDGYYPYCSECKKEPKNREMTKFCAECGAKMDKEEI